MVRLEVEYAHLVRARQHAAFTEPLTDIDLIGVHDTVDDLNVSVFAAAQMLHTQGRMQVFLFRFFSLYFFKRNTDLLFGPLNGSRVSTRVDCCVLR
jgi:hypothetical protein